MHSIQTWSRICDDPIRRDGTWNRCVWKGVGNRADFDCYGVDGNKPAAGSAPVYSRLRSHPPDPTEARAMTDLDQFRVELAGSLAGLSPSQRLKAGRQMAHPPGGVLAALRAAAIEPGGSGRAAGLVAAKVDRVSRSVLDTASLMEQARRGCWELVTCDLAIATSPPAGEATASMMAVFSQLERRLISQRTREALAVKKAQGVRLGRPSTLPREVVARIVAAKAGGASLRTIATQLTADAGPTAQGGAKWR